MHENDPIPARARPLLPPRLLRHAAPVELCLDLLWPRLCLGCARRKAETSIDLCHGCAARLVPSPRPACLGCARRLDSSPPPHDRLCGTCRSHPTGFERLLTVVDYRPPMDAVLLAFKFGAREYLGAPLGQWCHDQLREELRAAGPCDLVVPVPLARLRRWQRGYNQSRSIALVLAQRLGVPCRSLLTRRARPPQSRLPLSERRGNMRGAFSLRRAPRGLRVLLVDDVVTSGATLAEAARCLVRAGASGVVALALARTPETR